MALWEEDGSSLAFAVAYDGDGTNPDGFTNLSGPIINGTWDTAVALLAGDVGSIVIIQNGDHPAPGSVVLDGPVFFGEVLCIGPVLQLDLGSGSHSIEIPPDLALIGVVLETQAASYGLGPLTIHLLNGLDVTLGF
jgi:hypothetical protein